MKKYAIIDAVKNTQYGPQLDFSDFYMDYIEFEAADDDKALRVVGDIQMEHDAEYFKVATCRDYENAPPYAGHLWDISDEYKPRQVEF